MKQFLTESEKQTLKAKHKKERDKRVCDRIKAVLLHDKGWTYEQIAEALLLNDETVRLHIHDYLSSRKLKPENGGSSEKLTEVQRQQLLSHLEKHTYLYVKDIIVYVKASFGVTYTVPGMTIWLKTHGFSYKKPAVVPGKANLEAQKEWIEEYEKLKKTLYTNKFKIWF
jgi:transposase